MIQDGENGISANEEDKKPLEVPRLKFISSAHFPDRFTVANGFWRQTPRHDSLPDTSLIQSLCNLCNPEEYIHYYLGEAPVEGHCPICNQQMADISSSQRTGHIHDCFGRMHEEKARVAFSLTRLQHCKWGKCKTAFVQKPIYLPKDFANDISDAKQRRNLRAKESKRLNDLRRKEGLDVSPDQAVQSRKSISTHLKRHLAKDPTLCLWDKCSLQCASEQDLKRHLWKSHGVTLKQAHFEPKFCFEHPDSGWFTDEFDWEDHCEIHIKAPRRSLNLARSYHMFTAGLQCPFCLDTETLFSKRFTQFTNRGTFNRHVDGHEEALCDHPLKCPAQPCTEDLFPSYFELQIHLFDVHDHKLKGFTRSHGLQRDNIKPCPQPDHLQEQDDAEHNVDEIEDMFREEFSDWVLDLEDESEDEANDWADDSDDGSEGGIEDGISLLKDQSKRKMLLDAHLCKRQKY
jgi:hypothetical protein